MRSENDSEFQGLVAELVDITKICGGQVPGDESELWRELAIWRNQSPADTSAANAKLVLESLGESWDDDYLEDDGESPSLAAVEAVHAGRN